MALAWRVGLLLLAAGMVPAHAEHALLHGYGQADGLDNLAVTSVVQDNDGYLWAGTLNGLYRFDGQRFHRAADQELIEIYVVLPDPLGGLWVAAGNGLYHWRAGKTQLVEGPGKAPLLASHNGLAVDRAGTVWVVSNDQLYEIRGTTQGGSNWQVREVLGKPDAGTRPPRLYSVATTPDGTVWVGCEHALCRLEAGRLDPFVAGEGPLAHQIWSRLLSTGDGALWLRSAHRLARLPPGAQALVDMDLPASAAGEHGPNYPLVEDRQGRILTGGGSALARLDPRNGGSTWQVFDKSRGMPPGGRFFTVFSDREGGVWLSRGGSGLWQWLGYGRWEHWTPGDGLPHDVVWSVVRDREGVLHAATNAGVARFDERARRFETSPGTAGLRIMALHSDAAGQVWASAMGRLLRRPAAPANAFATMAHSEGWNFIHYKLLSRPDGELWFAGDEGVGWWPAAVEGAGPLGKPNTAGGGAGFDLCQTRTESEASVLWATTDQGLLRVAEAPAPRVVSPTSFTMMACGRGGVLYTADPRGHIFRIESPAASPRQQDITPALLAHRQIAAMLEDRRGWLWVNTDAGVAVWNGRLWRLLDQAQGLIWNDTSGAGLFEDTDGSMWISTSQGLSHLMEPETAFSPTLPPVRIDSIVHGGRPLAASHRLSLQWSLTEALEVAIESPSYRDRASQTFEHRLLGFDDRWQRTGGSVIRYARLPAGSYTLQARLVDQQLGMSSPNVDLHLEIDPPWWETWTFRLLTGALLAALAYAGHRWRMRLARQREQELAQLVAERTRELEASREELRERATKDGLTGAWNRRTVLEMLEHDVERSARDRQPLTVLLADIDHFKRINDELGHPAGDEVLRQFVARLRAEVRPYDAIGRYGGEEFVVILRGLCVDQAEDRARVEAMRAAIAGEPMMLAHGMQRHVTCSFGAACARAEEAATSEDLIRQADEALYRAKRAGRNRVEYAGTGK
ncbi:diguanylate cyclase [Ideonella sp. YS5]|uniref:ligand-binding sensor domain-containing diguanylate cyclase n=1 Tax=Ideonella sp. YS5 TaxID=3453714 RepID=UPI003F72AA87